MAKFLTGEGLESSIYDIIWEAEKTLLIVSPFIKLDDYFKKLFDKHIDNYNIHFIIIFGKNEKDISRSLSANDFDFFKKFLNISIVYAPNLHAKYYGNESKGVITSINLYDYSFKNNIEFGVYSEIKMFNTMSTKTDKEAWGTCFEIAEKSEAVFIKRPVFKKRILSSILGKNYVKSEILHDSTMKFYNISEYQNKSFEFKTLKDFPELLDANFSNEERPPRDYINNSDNNIQNINNGYCIRTGVRIPINIERPMCFEAYKVWNEYGDRNYPEKFCHFTGELSYGETSYNKPILNRNWRKYQRS
jgi:hypothetical protein